MMSLIESESRINHFKIWLLMETLNVHWGTAIINWQHAELTYKMYNVIESIYMTIISNNSNIALLVALRYMHTNSNRKVSPN